MARRKVSPAVPHTVPIERKATPPPVPHAVPVEQVVTPPPVPNAVPIEKLSGLSPGEVWELAFDAGAGEGRPLVLTDQQSGWAASRLWTFDAFARDFPDDPLIASDRAPYRKEDDPPMQTFRCRMREYCDYVRGSDGGAVLAARERGGRPFYGNSWAPFNTHPALRRHFSPPPSVPDLLDQDEPQVCSA